MKRLAKFFGGIILFLLGAVICTALSLFVLSAFCVSYPVLRLKPRDAKLKAVMDLLLAIATAVAVMKPSEIEAVIEAAVPEDDSAPTST